MGSIPDSVKGEKDQASSIGLGDETPGSTNQSLKCSYLTVRIPPCIPHRLGKFRGSTTSLGARQLSMVCLEGTSEAKGLGEEWKRDFPLDRRARLSSVGAKAARLD
ncbi:hypothetical protein Lal_00038448 [Lupinus albus]|nr:hypothetical protein Lal_00038448 [Lupinus albus]